MTTQYVTSTLNVAGSNFYPSGNASVYITTDASVQTTFSMTCTSSGTCSGSILVSNISGIATAKNITIYVLDVTRNLRSNSVVINVSNTVVSPVITSDSSTFNSYSQTAKFTGTGFSQGGSVNFTLKTDAGITTPISVTATSTGSCSASIPVTQINGVYTATTVSIQAEDMATLDMSNTISESVTTINVAPTITGPSTPIQIITY
jgi:hypothetical protein